MDTHDIFYGDRANLRMVVDGFNARMMEEHAPCSLTISDEGIVFIKIVVRSPRPPFKTETGEQRSYPTVDGYVYAIKMGPLGQLGPPRARLRLDISIPDERCEYVAPWWEQFRSEMIAQGYIVPDTGGGAP